MHPSQWTAFATGLTSRLLPSLSQADFARLWRANVGSSTAQVMQTVAVGWLVIELTESPFMLGLITFFRFAPMFLLSPFGGVLADRLNRVRLILIAQSAIGISALVIGVLVAFGWIEVWHLILGSLVMGVSFSINVPSRHAMMADLVPRKDVANAVGLNNVNVERVQRSGPFDCGIPNQRQRDRKRIFRAGGCLRLERSQYHSHQNYASTSPAEGIDVYIASPGLHVRIAFKVAAGTEYPHAGPSTVWNSDSDAACGFRKAGRGSP